jgi:hypothetical protein
MNGCEPYRINLSPLMDGELPPDDLADTIRHLAGCDACMKEFAAFQALQRKVNNELKAPAVPGQLWKAIQNEAQEPPRARSLAYRPTMMRFLRMAAVVIICFGLGWMLSKPLFKSKSYDPNTPIVLASARDSMSEERFLELTRELLTADPAYHRKMYLILSLLMDRYGEGNLQSLRETDSPLPVPTLQENGGGKVETFRF